MATGILTAALTTAPVNADAAGRGSAEERNRRAGIPACNAAGTTHVSVEEAVARAFGKPVPQDPSSFDDGRVCNDDGFLRFVPPPVKNANDPGLLQSERNMFRLSRSLFCLRQHWNKTGLVLLTETPPEREAANREKAISYTATIKTSPKFQAAVKLINNKHNSSAISGDILNFLWVGHKKTLEDEEPSHRICGFGPELWKPTDPPKQVAAVIDEIINYVLVLPKYITVEKRKQLSRRLAKIPALAPSSP